MLYIEKKESAFNNDYSKRMKAKIADYRRHFSLISNSYLKGTTFDAKHIDQMLKSEFADIIHSKNNNNAQNMSYTLVEKNTRNISVTQSMDAKDEIKPMKSNLHKVSRSVGGRKSIDPSSMIHATNVRFSASFLTPERESMKQTQFIEMYNCPALEISHKGKNADNLYEQQFESNTIKKYLQLDNEIKGKIIHNETPTQDDTILKTSKTRRLEFQKLRSEIKQSQDLRDTLRFLGKRERILKHAWKHGVMGFDIPQESQYKVIDPK